MRKMALLPLFFCMAMPLSARQKAGRLFPPDTTRYTHADTLRGAITPQRAWWDVIFYDLEVRIHPGDSSISGHTGIRYRVLSAPQEMQVDLMTPLVIDSVIQEGRRLQYRRDGNAYFIAMEATQPRGDVKEVTVYYHGHPRVARHPPWDGGFIWDRDSTGSLWIATACQGVGASIWWPNKDTQADEPDSQRIAITVPDTLVDVSNGRLRNRMLHDDGTCTYEWFVSNPINNYDVAVNVAKYTHFSDSYQGEDGLLTLDYYVLPYHLKAAQHQFVQVKSMLQCLEAWFGPYPWYKDGYKLVETPHLGMEHQSCVAYGNHYMNGYLGRDLSRTGWGLKWDFIIVHESAHEWFGNNITTRDMADMWVHESFANYAECLYTECLFGPEAGATYCRGNRSIVLNDRPIIPAYGVNAEGSGDMYPKGGNMLHTIRQIIGNDSLWKEILRGLNRQFRHQTVSGQQVEDYISRMAHMDLGPVFTQYLRTTAIPLFEYQVQGTTLRFRWRDVVPGFDMPLKVAFGAGQYQTIHPSAQWQTLQLQAGQTGKLRVDPNFYVRIRAWSPGA